MNPLLATVKTLFTQGAPESAPGVVRDRVIALNVSLLGSLAVLTGFTGVGFWEGDYARGFSAGLAGVFLLFLVIFLRLTRFVALVQYTVVTLLGSLLGYLVWTGGAEGSGPLWTLAFPFLALFLLGRGAGTPFALALGGFLGVVVLVPGLSPAGIPPTYGIRILGVYSLVFVAGFLSETLRLRTARLKDSAVIPAETVEPPPTLSAPAQAPQRDPLENLESHLQSFLQTLERSSPLPLHLNLSQFDPRKVPEAARDILVPVLEELIRNTLAHGLESRDQRLQLQKDLTAELRVSLQEISGLTDITYTDDGSGFDLGAIRQRAARLPAFRDLKVDSLDEAHLVKLVFQPEYSPRTPSLGWIRTQVERRGGTLKVRFLPGKFTEFHLRFPLDPQ